MKSWFAVVVWTAIMVWIPIADPLGYTVAVDATTALFVGLLVAGILFALASNNLQPEISAVRPGCPQEGSRWVK